MDGVCATSLFSSAFLPSSETLCLTERGHGMPCPYKSKESPLRGGRYLEFGTIPLRAVEFLSGKAGIFDRVPIGTGTLRMTSRRLRRQHACAAFPIVAELADEIERAGDKNGVFGRGFCERVFEGLLGVGDYGN